MNIDLFCTICNYNKRKTIRFTDLFYNFVVK